MRPFGKKLISTLGAVVALAVVASCGGDSNVETVDKSQHGTTRQALDNSATASTSAAGGITWSVPDGWEVGGPRTMRIATYTIGSGDAVAECAVFFFGPGQGGGVQANIDRWIGQITQADGSDSKSKAETSQSEVNGLAVSTVTLTGVYDGGMSRPVGENEEPTAGYRLLASIVEAPKGPVFFKMTGPTTAVDAAEDAFNALINSVKKG